MTKSIGDLGFSEPNSTPTRLIDSSKTPKSVRSVGVLDTHQFGTLHIASDRNDRKKEFPDCLLSGSVVIVTGMPPGFIFGFDTICFTLENDGHFDGIRDIPNGPHFIYGGSSSDLSTRTGFWIMAQRRESDDPGDIFVKRWNDYHETLEDELNIVEFRRQQENVRNIFDHLIRYTLKAPNEQDSFDSHLFTMSSSVLDLNIWNRLTFAIKGAMLSRIIGQPWNKWQVSSTHDVKPMEVQPTNANRNSVHQVQDARVEGKATKDSVLTFAFSRTGVTYSRDVTGRARTEQAMDTTAYVLSVISNRCSYEDSDEVIGELQFCYLTGILLGNMACQEQWAHMVKVIFKAFRLAMDMPVLFRKLIETFHTELVYDEEAIEGSIFDHDSYLQDELRVILVIFRSRLIEQLLDKGADLTNEQSDVGKAFEALETWLWKWGWDLRDNYLRAGKIQLEDGEFVDAELNEFEAEDERGEFAPMIVDIDENGREKNLISW